MDLFERFETQPPRKPTVKTNGIHFSQVSAVVELITPKMAEAIWEKRNELNRNLMPSVVSKYARDMKEGRWGVSGQGIIFDRSGRLTDGHHRIQACIAAQVPFETLVVRGVEMEAVGIQDIGTVRSAANIAHMAGVESASGACSIARLLLIHRVAGFASLKNSSCQPTKPEVVRLTRECKELHDSVVVGQRLFRLLSPSLGGFLHFIFSESDAMRADEFFDKLHSGLNLTESCPVRILRERLQDDRSKRARLDSIYIAAVCIKAWNAFIVNRKVGQLRWASDEPFPEVAKPKADKRLARNGVA